MSAMQLFPLTAKEVSLSPHLPQQVMLLNAWL